MRQKRIAHIIGLGRSGKAAALLLMSEGWRIIITDDNDNVKLRETAQVLRRMGCEVFLGSHTKALEKDVDLVVLSPGVQLLSSVVLRRKDQGVEIIGELELGWQRIRGSAAAVTATNGKSTVTALLGEIFRCTGRPAFACGNIGLALSEIAQKTTSETLLAVEVSSFQLMTIATFKPKVSLLLNITPDHIVYHGGFEPYKMAKAQIWRNQTSEDILVYNIDDPVVTELIKDAQPRKFPFSIEQELNVGAYIHGEDLVIRDESGIRFIIDQKRLQIPGKHNISNALAAMAAAYLMSIEPSIIEEGISKFKGLPHRLERIRELDGVVYYNDSKSTSPDSGRWALEAMTRPVIMIAGGSSKGGDFKSLRPYIKGKYLTRCQPSAVDSMPKSCTNHTVNRRGLTAVFGTSQAKVKKLLLIGETATQIEKDLGDLVSVEYCDSLAESVIRARETAIEGDAVLLSPFCASFDMFDNFEDRGNQFHHLVQELV